MTSTADLGQIKLAMLRQLDSTLQQNYHQTLVEVLNELRMRSVVSQPDPSPDKVFSVILQTHVLTFKPTPNVRRLKEALERMTRGEFGYCMQCGREIPSDILMRDTTVAVCSVCQQAADS